MNKFFLTNILVFSLLAPISLYAFIAPSNEDTEETSTPCVALTYYMSSTQSRAPGASLYTKLQASNITTEGQVGMLQNFLQENGYINKNASVSGRYGALTTAGVKKFQKDYKLFVTGATGPLTRAKIAEVSGCSSSQVQINQQAINSASKAQNAQQSNNAPVSTQNIIQANTSTFVNPQINFDSSKNYFTKGEKISFTLNAGSATGCEWYIESVSGGYIISSLTSVTGSSLVIDTNSSDFKTGETYRVGLRCGMGSYGKQGADTTGASSQIFQINSANEPSCTVDLEGNRMYRTSEQITAKITSSNVASVRFRVMSSLNKEVVQYQDFSTTNGTQTFPSGMLTPDTYIAEVEGVKNDGSKINCMPTSKLPFSVY